MERLKNSMNLQAHTRPCGRVSAKQDKADHLAQQDVAVEVPAGPVQHASRLDAGISYVDRPTNSSHYRLPQEPADDIQLQSKRLTTWRSRVSPWRSPLGQCSREALTGDA